MTTYYISNTGDDTLNDGLSPGAPWKTMAKVNAEMGTSDIFYFNRGDSWSDAILTVTVGGTSENPITFGAYGTGTKPIFNNTADGIRLWQAGANYITIQDIHCQGQTDSGARGIELDGAKTNITISRCDIDDPAHSGIAVVNTDTFIIEDCNIWESLGGIVVAGTASNTCANGIIRNNTIYRTTGNFTDGIYFFPTDGEVGSNFLIEGNTLYGWGEEALDAWSGTNFIVRDNIVYNNTRGLKVGDGGNSSFASNCFFDGNYSYNNGRGMYLDGGRQVRLRWNKVRDSSARFVQLNSAGEDFWACHNTFYDDDVACSSGTLHIWAAVGDIIGKNNIWVSPNNSNPTSFINDAGADSRTFDYNIYYRNDNDDTQTLWCGKNWADWQTEGQDANGSYADPKLINPPLGEFGLQSDSPCIDAGDWITTIDSATGSGYSFTVATGGGKWFCDGFGLTDGDEIQLEGKTTSVTITDVSGDVITVDESVSWTNGDGVAFTYSGSAPDLGAEEYVYVGIADELNLFEDFKEQWGKGTHQFHAAGHTIKAYLTNNTPSASADAVKADLVGITEENGYAPADIQNDYTETSGVGTLTGVDVVFTASGGSFGAFRYIVLYNDTAANDELIGWYDYGSSISCNTGESFTIDFGAKILDFE